MDHCIGCHNCAFTVAYAVLWYPIILQWKSFISGMQIGGEASPALFFKLKCPDFGKKTLILSIFRLNLPFKM